MAAARHSPSIINPDQAGSVPRWHPALHPDGADMYPVERALWFIENRLSGDISLQAIAASAGVSSHHLARAFGAATGQSLMRYARGRRLSEAARSLAAGASDILAVALDTGYGSHEAFTRAFREQFGVTP